MNSVDLMLLDLIQLAEAPLYSAYRWLGRELGYEISMTGFTQLLAPLVENDVVRLWSVEIGTGERTRWYEIPPDLEQRYAAIEDLDGSFDPFGLSLTIGSAADLGTHPEWEVDLDFDEQRFTLRARSTVVDVAWQQIRQLFPGISFRELDRRADSDRVRIIGSMAELPLKSRD